MWLSKNERVRHGPTLIGALILVLACQACTDQNETTIKNVCIKAGINDTHKNDAAVKRYCSCFATTAKKSLDEEDYALLAKLSSVYLSKDDGDIKVHRTLKILLRSGWTERDAALAAADLILLSHKVHRACPTRPGDVDAT